MSVPIDIQYRSVPLGSEGATAPTFIGGHFASIKEDVGNIELPNGSWLVVNQNGTYGSTGDQSQASVFTVARDKNANLLMVTSTEKVQFLIPYLGV